MGAVGTAAPFSAIELRSACQTLHHNRAEPAVEHPGFRHERSLEIGDWAQGFDVKMNWVHGYRGGCDWIGA